MPQQVWQRGDPVVRGSDTGFVAADMSDSDEYLMVRFQNGAEKIHRSKLDEIRRFSEAEANAVRRAGRSPIDDLRALESLERIEAVSVQRARTIKSPREQRMVDDLVRRAFAAEPECEWDGRNADLLGLLALEPDSVGWRFKLSELLHRPVHRLFHTAR